MFNNVKKTNDDFILDTDIGKINRFRFSEGFDFEFSLKDELQRKDMLKVNVKFKQKKHLSILTKYAKNNNGELMYPQDMDVNKLFEIVIFGNPGEEKDTTPEQSKFTEKKFSGFSN